MQPVVTDMHGVSLSVTQLNSVSLCKNGWTVKLLFGMNTLGGPRDIVLHRGPDTPIDTGTGTYF